MAEECKCRQCRHFPYGDKRCGQCNGVSLYQSIDDCEHIQALEKAIKNIAPWLSASLSDEKHSPCKEYITACNAIFDADAPDKPYFLPLMKEYYLKLKDGTQRSEIRPNNHRGWNTKNIFPGRVLNCSSGYGKHDRTLKTIVNTMVTHDLRQEDVAIDHIEAVEAIYGKRDSWLIARV